MTRSIRVKGEFCRVSDYAVIEPSVILPSIVVSGGALLPNFGVKLRFTFLYSFCEHRSVRRTMLFVLLALLTLWHGWVFLSGYRLTADDVQFTYVALQGPEEVFKTARALAESQGRIGFLFLQPINMFSALKSEFLAWRILFVVLYMLTVWLILIYAARVLNLAIAPLAFLIFLALHPLAFEHLPPTSFPLQNTLPFFVLVVCRLAANIVVERGAWMVLGRLLQIIAMLATEYALLLGVVMISAENLSRHPVRMPQLAGWLRALVSDSAVWRDVATIALVIGPYVGFRLVFPSSYDGNTLDGIGNLSAMMKTTWLHIVDGLVLLRFRSDIFNAPLTIWIGTALSSLGMYAAMRLAFLVATVNVGSPGPVVVFLLGAMLLVTIPVSASVKHQSWCNTWDHCAFLDSRTTIIGVVLLLALLISKLLNQWQNGTIRRNLQRLVSGVFAVIFAMGGLHNWNVAERMALFSEVWNNARTLACVPDLIPTSPEHLSKLIDPKKTISFHSPDTPLVLWPLYLAVAGERNDCGKAEVLNRSLNRSYLPILLPKQPHLIGDGLGGQYLGSGWSSLESWGVWSDGTEAELLISPQGLEPGEQAVLQLDAHMFIEISTMTQRLFVTQKGQTLWEGTLGPKDHNLMISVPLLPHDPKEDVLTLTLTMPDARAPESGGDTRQLGIGLKRLFLYRM